MAFKAALKITPQIDPAGNLQKLTLTVQRLNAQTIQLNQKISATLLQFPPSKMHSQQVPSAFRRFRSSLERLDRIVFSSLSRMVNQLGNFSKIATGGVVLESFVSPALRFAGSMTLGLVPLLIASTTGIFRWLWNQVSSVGDAMLQDRMVAMSAGTTVGGLRAFGIAFPMIRDPNVIGTIALTRIDTTSRMYSVLHGILKVKQSTDTMDKIIGALTEAREYMKKEPMWRSLLGAQGFGITQLLNPETLMALREMSDDEFKRTIETFHNLRGKFSQTTEAQNMLVDFILAVKTMWTNIETKLGKKLVEVGLTDTLKKLSEATAEFIKFGLNLPITQKMIKGFEEDLKWFSNWLGDTKNQKKIGKVVEGMILNFERGVI